MIDNYKNDIDGMVLMGDWNSIPSNTRKIMKNMKLLTTEYPTHVKYNMTMLIFINSK